MLRVPVPAVLLSAPPEKGHLATLVLTSDKIESEDVLLDIFDRFNRLKNKLTLNTVSGLSIPFMD